ncbi:hypothetical protein AVEN_42152-1 [Araneus ventricosus]|uniref:Uncharacterized protein n=1 Tax=Araneus ventricosus TaxID=182803 RepID=A0A4Y2D5R2_ARAVE|nr:hypothetical protein AVEN_42152-1 [Araneus ventricosus]
MESLFPVMLVAWLGREFYRGKYGMTRNSQAWNSDLGDHFGDKFGDFGFKSKIPKNAILFLISLLEEDIRLNVLDNSMRLHDLPGRLYKERAYITSE